VEIIHIALDVGIIHTALGVGIIHTALVMGIICTFLVVGIIHIALDVGIIQTALDVRIICTALAVGITQETNIPLSVVVSTMAVVHHQPTMEDHIKKIITTQGSTAVARKNVVILTTLVQVLVWARNEIHRPRGARTIILEIMKNTGGTIHLDTIRLERVINQSLRIIHLTGQNLQTCLEVLHFLRIE